MVPGTGATASCNLTNGIQNHSGDGGKDAVSLATLRGNSAGLGVLDIQIGNTSRWGTSAKEFLRASKAHIVSYVETHRDREAVTRPERERHPGRSHFWSPAVPSGKETSLAAREWANHGGVVQLPLWTVDAATPGAAKGS